MGISGLVFGYLQGWSKDSCLVYLGCVLFREDFFRAALQDLDGFIDMADLRSSSFRVGIIWLFLALGSFVKGFSSN